MREIEIISRRKKREKHFLREDGTILAKIYNKDIHFERNGRFDEIDNTLIRGKDEYINKNNEFKASFKDNSSKSLFRISKDENYLDFKLQNSRKVNVEINSKNKNCVVYKDVLDGIDLHYQMLPTKIKETIVLHNKNYDELVFEVDTNLELILNNNMLVAKKEGNIVFDVETPYMQDANGVINNNVIYSLKEIDGKTELKLILDKNWINAESTVYPICVDPTITNHSQEIDLYDTYIYPGDGGVNKGTQAILKAGVERVNGNDVINRTLIRFALPEIGTGSEVVRANLLLTSYPTFDSIIEDDKLVTMHRITTNWEEENANWETMHDKYDPKVESIFYGHRSYLSGANITPARNMYTGDITNLVKKWYRDTDNFGLLLKSASEVYEGTQYPAFCSKNYTDNFNVSENPMPVFELVYRNMNGVEDYYDYSIQNLSQGKIYVNNYTGNVTGIYPLGNTIGGKYPIIANLIYNTNDVVLNKNTSFGKGYKLNFNQTIQEVIIGGMDYLKYVDDDGTEHYFYKDTTNEIIYYDEDGIGSQITKNGSDYILNDKGNNVMIFSPYESKYYLTQITDAYNNIVSIIYDNNYNNIEKIIDSNNCEISFVYNEEEIDIVSPNGITKLNYNNGMLSNIEDYHGILSFTYSNDLIDIITDVNGIKLKYEYYEKKPYRLKKVTQYGINNSVGNYFTMVYGFNTTTITNHKGQIQTLIFNNNGNLLSINNLSSSEDVSNAYALTRKIDHNYNKLISETVPIKYVKNYLKNSSFENDTNYFSSSDGLNCIITDETSNSGNKCLKLINESSTAKSIYYNINVPKGQFYTFSGCFKNNTQLTISLSYQSIDGGKVFSEQIIDPSDEFEQSEVTIYFDNNEMYVGNLKLEVTISDGIAYIDDIQLEVGEVANSYNIIDNSDFSDGLSDWQLTNWSFAGGSTPALSDVFQVVNINNGKNTALKVNMNPSYGTRFIREIPLSGKEGDLYNISFWYKNEGIPGDGVIVGNSVAVYFKPIGNEADYCIATSDELHVDENVWQYFTFRYIAPEDYESIRLIFNQGREANNFYLTNLTLYKDLFSSNYEYDQNGNVISVKESSKNNSNIFQYDSNNQLISTTTPKGDNFKIEYDNIDNTKVLSATSSIGIVNEIKYDEFGNPILTRVSKKGNKNLDNGKYRIRAKGTEKYIKANYRDILVKSDGCSNTVWCLEKVGDQYKIIYDALSLYNLSCVNNSLKLTTLNNDNSLFTMEKNSNGSFLIKCNNNLYCKFSDNQILLTTLVSNDPSFEFYFESIDDIFIENTSTYSEDGKFITSVTDSNLNTNLYETDSNTGLLISRTNPNNNTVIYTYNNKKKMTSTIQGNKVVNYEYNDKNLLSKIIQGDRVYNLSYDEFLNLKNIFIGNNINLVTKNYNINNGELSSIRFGNGQIISYIYDEFTRLKTLNNLNKHYNFRYDNKGNISKILVSSNNGDFNSIYLYKYDDNNRMLNYCNDNFKIKYQYDENDNVVSKLYKLKDNLIELNTSVDNIFDSDNCLLKTQINTDEFNYEYDNLGRLQSININNHFISDYKYLSNGKRTTLLLERITNGDDSYDYKYDKLDNITEINHNGIIKNKYYYDEYSELIKEEDFFTNNRIIYNYDNAGNLLSATTINMLADEQVSSDIYAYSDNEWSDLLTNYNGKNITYDAIGNPITIGNNITLSWINGRELSNYTDLSKNLSVFYEYNQEGIRISKNVNNVESKYFLENDRIVCEQKGNTIVEYLYDLTGLVGMKYNGNVYYYVKNIQNDVIEILNSNYQKIVSYDYDGWGNLISIKDNLGNNIVDDSHIGLLNPFRYRSYYYDNETGLYYLNSRYYSPKLRRFINADGYLNANVTLLTNNLFLYCDNNPIMNEDHSGKLFRFIGNVVKTATKILKTSKTLSLAGGIALADGPSLVGDAIAGVLIAVAAIYSIKKALDAVATSVSDISIKKEEPKTETKICRWHYTTNKKEGLVPSQLDVDSGTGLSFSSKCREGSGVTTVEALESTLMFTVVHDTPTHYQVHPKGITLREWREQGINSQYTTMLESKITIWNGK